MAGATMDSLDDFTLLKIASLAGPAAPLCLWRVCSRWKNLLSTAEEEFWKSLFVANFGLPAALNHVAERSAEAFKRSCAPGTRGGSGTSSTSEEQAHQAASGTPFPGGCPSAEGEADVQRQADSYPSMWREAVRERLFAAQSWREGRAQQRELGLWHVEQQVMRLRNAQGDRNHQMPADQGVGFPLIRGSLLFLCLKEDLAVVDMQSGQVVKQVRVSFPRQPGDPTPLTGVAVDSKCRLALVWRREDAAMVDLWTGECGPTWDISMRPQEGDAVAWENSHPVYRELHWIGNSSLDACPDVQSTSNPPPLPDSVMWLSMEREDFDWLDGNENLCFPTLDLYTMAVLWQGSFQARTAIPLRSFENALALDTTMNCLAIQGRKEDDILVWDLLSGRVRHTVTVPVNSDPPPGKSGWTGRHWSEPDPTAPRNGTENSKPPAVTPDSPDTDEADADALSWSGTPMAYPHHMTRYANEYVAALRGRPFRRVHFAHTAQHGWCLYAYSFKNDLLLVGIEGGNVVTHASRNTKDCPQLFTAAKEGVFCVTESWIMRDSTGRWLSSCNAYFWDMCRHSAHHQRHCLPAGKWETKHLAGTSGREQSATAVLLDREEGTLALWTEPGHFVAIAPGTAASAQRLLKQLRKTDAEPPYFASTWRWLIVERWDSFVIYDFLNA